MIYDLLKIIHIISASLFIGALWGSFYFTFYFRKSLCHAYVKHIIHYDSKLSLFALLIQPISGFAMIAIQSYNPLSHWVLGTITLYAAIGCLWLVGLFQQQRLLHQLETAATVQIKPYIVGRSLVLIGSVTCLFVLYYLMIHRPA
ncbi:MAG: hypothetical protein A3F10_07395 [Coxiella sp. RIFCSPHIGHO2_12_FULL_42_15]|nr:MAG: hypothetical protein A3F10_07395 [Coxiella sp. RIFCSPHIGHO2_12_FULL_42_15]